MSSDHYECPENSTTDISECEKEQLVHRNHFDAILGTLKEEIIKEELTEIKSSSENGVYDESSQMVGEDEKFLDLDSSNYEKNSRESKPSLTQYIFAADDQEVDQTKKKIKVEDAYEDHPDFIDDLSTINTELKTQTLKSEDGVDLSYENIKPGIDGNKLSGNNIANIVSQESSVDFGAVLQQNATVDEDKTDVERDNEKQFQCNFCSNFFTRSSALKTHERTHTGEKPFQCNLCSKSFKQSSTLKNHERTHTGEKPFHCNLCSQSFSRSANLKIHERTHTGEKPFQCNFCLKSSTQSTALKFHERTHTGEKPFQCKICLKWFTRKDTFKLHLKTHTGEKPFHCNLCSKTFIKRTALKFHERTHTGDKPFQCKICLKWFTRTDTFKRHVKTHTR